MNTIIERRRKFHRNLCAVTLGIIETMMCVGMIVCIPDGNVLWLLVVMALVFVVWMTFAKWWMRIHISSSATILFFDTEENKEKGEHWAAKYRNRFGVLFLADEDAEKVIELYKLPQALICMNSEEQQQKILELCKRKKLTICYPGQKRLFDFF